MFGMVRHERERWHELTQLLNRLDRGIRTLSVAEVQQVCRLYRQVTIDLSRARADGGDLDRVRFLNALAARAHGAVYRARRVGLRPLATFITAGFPQLVRQYRWFILTATAVFVLSSLFSFLAVLADPELAYSLFDEKIVEYENVRLEKQEGEYKGNFTFGTEVSPLAAAQIIGNNVRVAVTVFAVGALCCIPGIMLLISNGRMLGTLSGLVWNHGYFVDFYALIMTHGVLELSAICISGGAGLMLGWAVIAPGQWPRREALRRAAGPAFGLLGGATFMLIVAGIIEAFVTPHFGQPVRWSVAILSGIALTFYLLFAGRPRPPALATADHETRSPGTHSAMAP